MRLLLTVQLTINKVIFDGAVNHRLRLLLTVQLTINEAVVEIWVEEGPDISLLWPFGGPSL
jgi:hypothetical protein